MNELIIMARRPELGKGKTRLAAKIGESGALKVYQYLLDHTLYAAQSELWKTNLFLTGEAPFQNGYGFEEFEQVGGSLGTKMKHAFQQFSTELKLVMIGTDCPEVTSEIIAKAYQELETKEVVFGPSQDGGYYLIGMKPFCEELLEDISWSTNVVLSESKLKCEKLGKSFALLPELNDIDTIEDLRASKLTSTFDF